MNDRRNLNLFLLGFLAVFSLMTAIVFADSDEPYGVRTIEYIDSSRPNESTYVPDDIGAEAGNVTEINLTAISTTKAWAGFYGNISGVITLEDALGYVFYNWTANEPKGEVYASFNDSVTWADIVCFEFDGSNGNFDVDAAEGWYGIENDDEDGINETFTDDTNIAFQVGTVSIVANTCPATNTYRDGQQQVNEDFENVLLTDQDVLVFTTIIENNEADNATDITGYDAREHDFQLLVAENGQDGFEDGTTTYYFWAEIE